MENHRIILSKEFISDYSKDNKNNYKKGTHRENNKYSKYDQDLDPDKVVLCSKFQEELCECIRSYYNSHLTKGTVTNHEDGPEELLRCGNYFKEYESCLKKL